MAETQLIKEALEQELGKVKKHDVDREAKYVLVDLYLGSDFNNRFPQTSRKMSSMIVLQERFDALTIFGCPRSTGEFQV